MLVRRGNDILVIRKAKANEWQFPAGGRDQGETVLQTAERELQEELNLGFDQCERVAVSFIVREYEWGPEWKAKRGCDGQRQHMIIIDLKDGVEVTPDGQEIGEAVFVPKEELLSRLSHEDLREVVRQMQALGELD